MYSSAVVFSLNVTSTSCAVCVCFCVCCISVQYTFVFVLVFVCVSALDYSLFFKTFQFSTPATFNHKLTHCHFLQRVIHF